MFGHDCACVGGQALLTARAIHKVHFHSFLEPKANSLYHTSSIYCKHKKAQLVLRSFAKYLCKLCWVWMFFDLLTPRNHEC
jgi:hypothetical protein